MVKKTMIAVAPRVDNENEDAGGAAAIEERMIEQLLLEVEEENGVLQLLIRTIINTGVSLLFVSFLIYATLFRRNDVPEVWIAVLISMFLVQSLLTHNNTDFTSVGVKLIKKVNSAEANRNLSLWKRSMRCYKHYFSAASDGLYAEWVLLFGEGFEIHVQVCLL